MEHTGEKIKWGGFRQYKYVISDTQTIQRINTVSYYHDTLKLDLWIIE